MTDYEIELRDDTDGLWITKPMVDVGRGWRPDRTADVIGLVTHSGMPLFLVSVYAARGEYVCFREALVWRNWAVVGYGHSVYFVDLTTHESKQHWLDAVSATMPYFGHLYPGYDHLLVATGSNIIRFDKAAEIVWASQDVGLDGVLIHDVDGERIRGDGEWDPPGGWLPFTMDLRTGQLIERERPCQERQPKDG